MTYTVTRIFISIWSCAASGSSTRSAPRSTSKSWKASRCPSEASQFKTDWSKFSSEPNSYHIISYLIYHIMSKYILCVIILYFII